MKELCPDCKTDTIDIPLTSLGKDAPDRIVSYLRSHPKVNYVVLSESGSLGPGLTGALRAAGLADKVKIVGQGGNEAVYQEVKAGRLARRGAVRAVLLRLRHARRARAQVRRRAGGGDGAGVLADDEGRTLPATIDGPAFPIVEDYKAQWAKLWGK